MQALFLVLLLLRQESVDAVLARALDADRDGRVEEAASGYLEALKLRPEIAALHSNLAWVRVRQGRLNEALLSLERATALDSTDVTSYLMLGRVLRDLENPERALEAFETAVTLDPSSRDGYFELADLHQSRREFDRAEAWLSRYSSLDPNDVEALYFLGTVLSYQSQLERSLEVLDKVTAKDPRHARAWFRKAHVEAQKPSTMRDALDS